MSKIFLTVLMSFAIMFCGYAQSVDDSINSKPLLFGSFLEGVVLMKSGAIEKASLNYNTDDQSIIFIQNGKYMVLTGLEMVDTIYIQQKKFVPVNNSVYQTVSTATPINFLVSYSNKKKPVTATTDHNGTSKQANSQVSNTVSDIYVNRVFKAGYSVDIVRHFWILKEGSLYKANSKKQFLRIFPQSKLAIENFMSSNSIDINKEADLTRLFDFCNTL